MQRHIMHNNYDTIRLILSSEGIKNPGNISILDVDNKEGYIDSMKYPWVKYVYEKLEENNVAAQTELCVWKNNPGQYFQINGMNCINKYNLSKFSCFFPGRTIVSAGDIKKVEDVYYIQANALFNFFFADIIAENDLGLYTPNSINGRTLKSIVSSPDDMYRIADLDTVQEGKNWTSKNEPIVDYLYVSLPWLYNASVQDYIDIINKYENEFNNYNRYINELAKITNSEYEITQNLVKDINDLKLDLNIKLSQKKDELKKKGINTFVGVCFTAIPFIINSNFEIIDPAILSALIGGKTIWDCADMVSKGLVKNNLSRNNPLWVIWKWLSLQHDE